MNILIVKLSAIGDVIHTLPALNAIRNAFVDAKITWLVETAAADLILGHRAVDRVIVSQRKNWIKDFRAGKRTQSIKSIFKFVQELRDTYYDWIIDFQALLKSSVWIALARGGNKLGFDRGMEHMEHSYLFLNRRIKPISMEVHALTRNMKLIEAMGIRSDKIEYHIPITDDDRHFASLIISGLTGTSDNTLNTPPVIAINPVAGWKTKLWENQNFSDLADRLLRAFDARLIFTGSAGDRPTIEMIMTQMKENALNLAGKTTLKQLAAVYEQAKLVITTDTGPMHLSAAVGTAVVALFGPTAPWRTGPFGSGHQVIRQAMHCSPCFKRTCDTIDCMKNIDVENVMASVERILKNDERE